MIEYPSIQNSNKSPRANCVAFNKLDGSNIRIKWTKKTGFNLFGSRTNLIDKNHPFLAEVIPIFMDNFSEPLEKAFVDNKYDSYREIVVFGEFLGDSSFAGWHEKNEPHKFVLFDVMLGHKSREFVKPYDFLKDFGEVVETPDVIYTGQLTDQFIADVRVNKYNLKEGVICKGTSNTGMGAHRGKMWMCKIKTQAYFDKLKGRFGEEWEKYGE